MTTRKPKPALDAALCPRTLRWVAIDLARESRDWMRAASTPSFGPVMAAEFDAAGRTLATHVNRLRAEARRLERARKAARHAR